jgi:NAD(P)-dependent dehydrogenase (short-subunit alcohol dehydrogenase family)
VTVTSLDGKTAIVTGAARGIGRAIAMALAREGMTIVAVSRTRSELEDVVSAIAETGGRASAVVCDVTDREAAEHCVRDTQQRQGGVELLVNNAGSFRCLGPIWETDPEIWMADLQVAVHGTYYFSRAALRIMIAGRAGRIVNLVGGGTSVAIPFASAYSLAKTAVMRFTECVAVEGRAHGVRAFALQPGLVATRLTTGLANSEAGRRWRPQLGKWLRDNAVPPENAARQVVWIAKGAFDAFSGRSLSESDDHRTMAAQAEEICQKDLRALRMQ